MSSLRFFQASAIATLIALTMAACGSSDGDGADDTSSGNGTAPQPADVSEDTVLFDFTEQAARAMPAEGVQEITFQVHPDLIEANPDYADQRVLDSVTVSSWDGGESQCGIEIRYDYATGAKEELDQHTYYRTVGDLPKSQDGTPSNEYNEHVKYTHALGGSANFTGQGVPTQDYTLIQRDRDCATGPTDDSNNAQGSVEFRSIEWVDTTEAAGNTTDGVAGNMTLETDTFAEADINVMANGDLHVAGFTVHGWTQDTNGDWIPDN